MAVCGEVSGESVCVKLLVLLCVYGSAIPGGQSARVVTEGNITATVGGNVLFRCDVQDPAKIIMVEWTRCDPLKKILVFMPDGSNLSVSHTHKGRVTMTTAISFTLMNVTEKDFGLYCCKVNVFPGGVLEGTVDLNQSQHKTHPTTPTILVPGLPPQVVYILGGVAGAVLLVVVVAAVLVCKRRRAPLRDYVNVSGPRGRDPHDPCDTGQPGSKGAEEEEEVDYLNCPGQEGAGEEDEEEDEEDYLNCPGQEGAKEEEEEEDEEDMN